MTDWAQYAREVQAAADSGWKRQEAEIKDLSMRLKLAELFLKKLWGTQRYDSAELNQVLQTVSEGGKDAT